MILTFPCVDKCSMFVIDKDEDFIYFSIQDARYDHSKSRVLNALKLLFGRRVHYNEVIIRAEDYPSVLQQLQNL